MGHGGQKLRLEAGRFEEMNVLLLDAVALLLELPVLLGQEVILDGEALLALFEGVDQLGVVNGDRRLLSKGQQQLPIVFVKGIVIEPISDR